MEVIKSTLNQLRTHLYKYRYIYIVLAAVSIIYIIPLIFAYLPKGHDIPFHITRLRGLAEEIKLGNIPARIYSTVYYNYGYASPLFYGDWLLYIPASLVVCGFSVYTAYKMFIMACLVMVALSMYFSAQVMFKDKKAACVAALLYSLSTYLGTDALVRHAVGELQSFIFIPIAIAGLYDIIFHEGKRWLLLPLGMCGVIVSHTLTSVLTVGFLALFALMFIDRFFKKPKKLLLLLASAGIFILLAASFIFPMIEQLESTKFLATDGVSAIKYGTLELRAMPSVYSLFSVLNKAFSYNNSSIFVPQGVGLALPFMIGWYIAYRKKVFSRDGIAFMILALLALFITSRLFPWENLQDQFGTLQFPWRIMLFAAVFIALFGGIITKKLEGTNTLSIFLSVIIIISAFSISSTILWKYQGTYVPTRSDYNNFNYKNEVGSGEYLPTGTIKYTSNNRGEIITSNATISYYNIERQGDVLIVNFSDIIQNTVTEETETYIDLPLIMYKGYKATIETAEGIKELPLYYGKNNIIRVYIGDNEAGTIKVWYDGTTIQKITFIISLLSFGGIIAYYGFTYYKRKKGNGEIEEKIEKEETDNESPLLDVLNESKT